MLSKFRFQYTLLVPRWWLYISRIRRLCLWDIRIVNFSRYLQGGDVWVHGGSRRAGANLMIMQVGLNFWTLIRLHSSCCLPWYVKLLVAFLWKLWDSCTYDNVIVFGDPNFGCVEHGATLLLLPFHPKRYLSTKFDREPCVVKYFFRVFRPYTEIDFFHWLTIMVPLTIEWIRDPLDDECLLMGY